MTAGLTREQIENVRTEMHDRFVANSWLIDTLCDMAIAHRAALEQEPVAVVAEDQVLEWCPPYDRPPVGTKLYAAPQAGQINDQRESGTSDNSGGQAGKSGGSGNPAGDSAPASQRHPDSVATTCSTPAPAAPVLADELQNWLDYSKLPSLGLRREEVSLCVSALRRSSAGKDVERISYLEQMQPVQIDWTQDEPEQIGLWIIRGRNDREWTLKGQGLTVRDAIDAAKDAPCQG